MTEYIVYCPTHKTSTGIKREGDENVTCIYCVVTAKSVSSGQLTTGGRAFVSRPDSHRVRLSPRAALVLLLDALAGVIEETPYAAHYGG